MYDFNVLHNIKHFLNISKLLFNTNKCASRSKMYYCIVEKRKKIFPHKRRLPFKLSKNHYFL